MGSHAFFLQLQDPNPELHACLARADLEAAPMSEAERALLHFVETVTRHAYRTTGLASGLKPLRRHSATSPSRRATIRTDNGPRVRFSATVGEEPDVEVGLA